MVEHNLKIHADNPVGTVLATISLEACKNYIMYAANEIELDEDSKLEYCKTWLYKHRLTIMEEGVLKFNFPTLPRLLIEILFNFLQTSTDINSIHCRTPSVNGFMFEAEFFECCKGELTVSFYTMDNDKPVTLSFTVLQARRRLTTMHKNMLYELRVLYPTIDGVGY